VITFREFVSSGAFSDTGKDGFDNAFFGIGHSLDMPMPTLNLPTRNIEGRVKRINYTSNPISVVLDNGTIWNLTKQQWDYLKTTGKEPKINSSVNIEMYIDGTIKSLTPGAPGKHNPQNDPVTGKESNKKSMLGGVSNRAEKTFGRKPF
jgi:hypothetical protein